MSYSLPDVVYDVIVSAHRHCPRRRTLVRNTPLQDTLCTTALTCHLMPGSKTNPFADWLVTDWRWRTIDVRVISFHYAHYVLARTV